MDKKKIEEMVNQVFEESFEIDKGDLSPEKGIFEDLGLDSLDIVDLVVALQKKFGVKIRDDNRVREIRTLGDIYNFIESLYNEGNFSADK
ncbi:MAG: acyl carrier protein [Candidatus Aceula meridiana]|nr:acyl carrier protein [Candidatus Aceula meridiana]